MNNIITDENDIITLKKALFKLESIRGYLSLPAFWLYRDEKIKLMSFSYCDVLLKDIGPSIRPLVHSKRDGINIQENVLDVLGRYSFSTEISNKIKDLGEAYDKALNKNSVLSMIENSNLDYSEINVYNDGDFVEEVTIEGDIAKSDIELYKMFLYGYVIHDTASRKRAFENFSKGQNVLAITCIISFIQNIVEISNSIYGLLLEIGIEKDAFKGKLRPNFSDVSVKSSGNDVLTVISEGVHYTAPYIEEKAGNVDFACAVKDGKGAVLASIQRGDNNIFVYSSNAKVFIDEETNMIKIEEGEGYRGRLVLWDPKRLKDGRLWAIKGL